MGFKTLMRALAVKLGIGSTAKKAPRKKSTYVGEGTKRWVRAQYARFKEIAHLGNGRFDEMTRQRRRREEWKMRVEAVNEVYPNEPRSARRNIARRISDERLRELLNAD